MQAIQTKYRGATANSGSAIIASAPAGHFTYKVATLRESLDNKATTTEQLHRLAALNFALRMNWGWTEDTMVTGWLPGEVLAHVSTVK